MTYSQLYKAVDESNVLTKEMLNIFKELDTTQSTATQASLNNMLLDLRKRITNGEKIIYEATGKLLDKYSFDELIQNTLEEYSVKLYMSSIQ